MPGGSGVVEAGLEVAGLHVLVPHVGGLHGQQQVQPHSKQEANGVARLQHDDARIPALNRFGDKESGLCLFGFSLLTQRVRCERTASLFEVPWSHAQVREASYCDRFKVRQAVVWIPRQT